MPGQVSGVIKDARSDKMEALEREMSVAFRKRHIGKAYSILFEEEKTIDGKKYYIGHTPEYIKVAAVSDADLSDKIETRTLTAFLTDDILLAE